MEGSEINDVVNSVHIKLTNLFCLTSYKYLDKPEIYFVRIPFVSSQIRGILSNIIHSISVCKIS